MIAEFRSNETWLLFVNDSVGELDWLAPFLVASVKAGRVEKVVIEYSLPSLTFSEIANIHRTFFADVPEIMFYKDRRRWFMRKSDKLFNFLRRLNERRFGGSTYLGVLLENVKVFLAFLCSFFVSFPKVTYYFCDYNLEKSVATLAFETKNRESNLIIYPHSTALMLNNENMIRRPPKVYECFALLENSAASNYFEGYGDKIKVVGSPSLDEFESTGSVIQNCDNVLFITRAPDEINFGLSEERCRELFKSAMDITFQKKMNVFVKHHPRQKDLSMWRSLYHENVTELDVTLNRFSVPLRLVLSFYSSAPVLFAKNAVACFDVGGIEGNVDKLEYHFIDENGNITHELINQGIIAHWAEYDLKSIFDLQYEELVNIGENQKRNVERTFPKNANLNIWKFMTRKTG